MGIPRNLFTAFSSVLASREALQPPPAASITKEITLLLGVLEVADDNKDGCLSAPLLDFDSGSQQWKLLVPTSGERLTLFRKLQEIAPCATLEQHRDLIRMLLSLAPEEDMGDIGIDLKSLRSFLTGEKPWPSNVVFLSHSHRLYPENVQAGLLQAFLKNYFNVSCRNV